MSELRRSTRAEHLALEELLPFFQPGFSLQRYVNVLERFYGIFEPLEPAIQSWLLEVTAAAPRAGRARLIEQDLIALGKTSAEVAALPRSAELPRIQSLEDALGSFYVLEGSMLGGQAISRELRTRFAVTPETGAAFFSSSGIDLKTRWLEDQGILRAHLISATALENAISSANATFRAFKNWLIP